MYLDRIVRKVCFPMQRLDLFGLGACCLMKYSQHILIALRRAAVIQSLLRIETRHVQQPFRKRCVLLQGSGLRPCLRLVQLLRRQQRKQQFFQSDPIHRFRHVIRKACLQIHLPGTGYRIGRKRNGRRICIEIISPAFSSPAGPDCRDYAWHAALPAYAEPSDHRYWYLP